MTNLALAAPSLGKAVVAARDQCRRHTDLIFVTVEFLNSDNPPIPIPDSLRLSKGAKPDPSLEPLGA